MRMVYGLLADFVTLGANSKPVIVGVFDRLFTRKDRIAIDSLYLIAVLECSIGEGEGHDLQIHLKSGSGQQLGTAFINLNVRFGVAGPGYPLRHTVILNVQNLELPDHDDYEFSVCVDGRELESIPLVVVDIESLPKNR